MKRRFVGIVLPSILILLAGVGCNTSPTKPAYQKELTVFGYLWANERLSSEHAVWIAYTRPIMDTYRSSEAALSGGDVFITEGSSGASFRLHEDPEKPGYYCNDSLLVLPGDSYRLQVVTTEKTVTAETDVPLAFELITALRTDTVNVVRTDALFKDEPIYLQCENPDQVVLVDMTCNESFQNAEYIHPFSDSRKHPETQDEYDGGENREPRHIFAIARVRDFQSAEYGGQSVIFWYTSLLVFYGSYTLQVAAVDDNLHGFLYKEHPEMEGGIQGGIGVFGSLCGKRFRFQVVK